MTCRTAVKSMINGANISAPEASPSHHVSQMYPYCDHAAYPPTARLVTPIVALTLVARKLERTAKRKTSGAWSNARVPSANRRRKYAPSTPSSGLPAAMASEVAIDPALVRLATNAPAKIAGQASRPISRHAAIAMPDGGHTAVALGLMEASERPAFAAAT